MAPAGSRTRLTGVLLRTQPDARLVLLAREGHGAALEEIVRRYRPGLVAFASGIVPAHRSEDVVQESLTRAFAALRAPGAEIVLRPWLYTIVRNRALNDLRDEPVHAPLDDGINGVPQPPDVAARREELASVVTRIQGLPDAQRQALVQRELEGRSHQEIADSIGTSPGAVRQLIFRARASLRAAGFLVPTPMLRYLPDGGYAGAGAVGLGTGGGLGLKAGAVLVAGTLAVGSGVALRERGGEQQATAATKTASPLGHDPSAIAARGPAERFGVSAERSEGSGDDGDGPGEDGGANSGPGDGGGGSHSGPGDGSGSGEGLAGSPELQSSSGPGPGGSTSSGAGSDGPGSGDLVQVGSRDGPDGGSGSEGPG